MDDAALLYFTLAGQANVPVCSHECCYACLSSWQRKAGALTCPVCRATADEVRRVSDTRVRKRNVPRGQGLLGSGAGLSVGLEMEKGLGLGLGLGLR